MNYTKGKRSLTGQDDSGAVNVFTNKELIATFRHRADAQLDAAAPELYEGLKDALKEICRMCVKLNPQHKNCTSCEEMERSRLPLAKAEGK